MDSTAAKGVALPLSCSELVDHQMDSTAAKSVAAPLSYSNEVSNQTAPAPPSLLRHFIVPFTRVAPRWREEGKLDLERTRGDVVVRCLVSALLVSRGTRNDATFTAALLGGGGEGVEPLCALACGAHIRGLRPDESSTAGLIRRALPPPPLPGEADNAAALDASGELNSRAGARACAEGFWVRRGALAAALEAALTICPLGSAALVCVCTEGAPPLASLHELVTATATATENATATATTAFVFILGDDAGLTPANLADIAATAAARGARCVAVSLGPTELLASAAITLIHAILDEKIGASDTGKDWRRAGTTTACRACNVGVGGVAAIA